MIINDHNIEQSMYTNLGGSVSREVDGFNYILHIFIFTSIQEVDCGVFLIHTQKKKVFLRAFLCYVDVTHVCEFYNLTFNNFFSVHQKGNYQI